MLGALDAGGHGGDGEHFPASRSCSGSGGSGTGRRSRSCPPALLLVDLPGRPVAVRLMKAFLVVKVQPSANARLGFGDRRVGVQVYVFVFQASPKPLDEDVVHAPAVHADPDAFSTPVKSVLVN